MTQNQVAYQNMLINKQNAESNRLQALAAGKQAEASLSTVKQRKREANTELWTGIGSTILSVGALALLL